MAENAPNNEPAADARPRPLSAYSDRSIFEAGGRVYQGLHAVLLAMITGRWASFIEEIRFGLACSARLDESDAEPPPIDDEVQAWLRARGMKTTDEAEASLAPRGLSLDDLVEHLGRGLLRAQWIDERASILAAHPIDDDEVERALLVEVICAGKLDDFARALAEHVALVEWASEKSEATSASIAASESEINAIIDALPSDRSEALLGVEPGAIDEAARHVAALVASYRRAGAAIATRAALEEHVRGRALDWIRLEGAYVAFTDLDVAREAAMCLREDGMDIAEVAESSKASIFRRDRLRVRDIPPEAQPALLSARRGDVLGPMLVMGHHTVVVVENKVVPSLDDPETRALAERGLLEQVARREAATRIRWIAHA